MKITHSYLVLQGQESKKSLDLDSQGSSESFDLESRNSNRIDLKLIYDKLNSQSLEKRIFHLTKRFDQTEKVKDLEILEKFTFGGCR